MKTSVLITAVAGSGKSTVCKALQKLGYHARDIERIDGLYELVDEQSGKVLSGGMDQIKEGVAWNCNKSKLKDIIRAEPAELTFYCGGMANTEDVWDAFDLVIVLTVSDATTAARLSTRRAGEFGSTPANRDWTLSWKQEVQQGWFAMGGAAISAEESPEQVARAIIASIPPENRTSA